MLCCVVGYIKVRIVGNDVDEIMDFFVVDYGLVYVLDLYYKIWIVLIYGGNCDRLVKFKCFIFCLINYNFFLMYIILLFFFRRVVFMYLLDYVNILFDLYDMFLFWLFFGKISVKNKIYI